MPSKFTITSRPGLRRLQYAERYAVISITDFLSKPAYIHDKPGKKAVLRLQFDDVKSESGTAGPYHYCTPDHADAICRFVKRVYDQVDQIVVHCEAGVSRSAAIACTLAELIEGSNPFIGALKKDGQPKYFPNEFVCQAIKAAWARSQE